MRTIDTIPKIMKMAVYPVAGYDSMTLTLSGAHAPYFTRNIVVLEDETGQREWERFMAEKILQRC